MTPQEIINENPNTGFPDGHWSDEMLVDLGYATLYEPESHPFPGKYEELVAGPITLIGGKYTKSYVVQSTVPTDPVELEKFIADEKTALKSLATLYRYQNEVAGILIDETNRISTDAVSQGKIAGAYQLSLLTPTIQVDWKTNTGEWIILDATKIAEIFSLVANHVQALFSKEKRRHDAIALLTTVEEIKIFDLLTIE